MIAHLTAEQKEAVVKELRTALYTALTPLTQQHQDAGTCACCYGKCEASALIEVLADSVAITAGGVSDPQLFIDRTFELLTAAIAYARDVQAGAVAAPPTLTADPKGTVH